MRFWPSMRRRRQLAVGLLSVVAVLIAADLFMIWHTDARLQKYIDAIRAACDPAMIADLAPEPITPNENAACHLERIAPKLDEFAKEYGREASGLDD